MQGYKVLNNRLTSQFKWRQFYFCLYALVIVEKDLVVNDLPGLLKGRDLLPADTFRFEDGEELLS